MDPLSIVALGAAVGGAAGKFVEKVWDSGEKWLETYFKNHKVKSQEKAFENSKDFLAELANDVRILENEGKISKQEIENAQDHPDFSALLQKAMLTSAQTDVKEKHILLARLVSERLTSNPETTFALSSKRACDAITYTNTNQLKILSILTNLLYIRPEPWPPQNLFDQDYQDLLCRWLGYRFSFYNDLTIKSMDLIHLEALSCIRFETIISRHLNNIFSIPNVQNQKFDFDKFKSHDVIGIKIEELWNKGALNRVSLTSIGLLIGIFTSDLLTDSKTNLGEWE